MRHYIILTSGIFEMGGAEMFTANKIKYLKSVGWKAHVYYYRKFGNIKIPELKQFENNNIPELLYGITYISKRKREEIINRICEEIKYGDEVIIESHILNLAYWGELIAKRCRGKSIINAMEENFSPMNEKEVAFIEFKMKRMEILNATPKNLHRYLSDHYKDEYVKYTHKYMVPFCSNVVTEEDFNISLPKNGQNILSIGRLDKPYVMPMFEEIKRFAESNPQKTYNLLIIGGSPKGTVENKIKHLFSGINNIFLYEYGYVFPIPRNLIDKADVSIASANSVLVSYDRGIPTIAIDIHDLHPMGVFGYTTKNKFSRTNEPHQTVSELLNEILNENKYPKQTPNDYDEQAMIREVFGKQIKFLSLSPFDNIYYDVESVYHRFTYFKNQFKNLVKNIIGY